MCSPGNRMNSWTFPPETPNASLQEDPYLTWILRESGRFERSGSRPTRHSPGPLSPTPLFPSATGRESGPVAAAQALAHGAWGSRARHAGLKACTAALGKWSWACCPASPGLSFFICRVGDYWKQALSSCVERALPGARSPWP